MVFLFDPGGSFPGVDETETHRYIYFDVLQFRGQGDEDRKRPLDPIAFKGVLIHEFFHQFQTDTFDAKSKADWLLKASIGEGSAMLIGNNAFGDSDERFDPNRPTYLKGSRS
ncbi:hypothetical protein EBR96_07885 [bacterium]|nr:hypothetical protein [bacterium]